MRQGAPWSLVSQHRSANPPAAFQLASIIKGKKIHHRASSEDPSLGGHFEQKRSAVGLQHYAAVCTFEIDSNRKCPDEDNERDKRHKTIRALLWRRIQA